ncbi:MAG: carboxypeptidase-like regulatory domain-containing protein [Pirellulaceae bacterium]|nr:carboxypeptidase regulatory-like domain-containing protein [Planctomycetales bacterium]
MIHWNSHALSFVVACLLVLTGCGDGRPRRVHVSGVVTFEGTPVEGAHVMFTPTGARPASARTDADGRFELRTFDENDGAVIGTHLVTIAKKKFGQDPYAAAGSALPERYGRTDTSGLSAEVTADGPNDFRFDLTAKE